LGQRLFWVGVGLAPLAVLVVLFGGSTGALRIAVAFAVLSIVALAVSIAMRPSVEMVRVDIEHRFLDEVERVRAGSREEVSLAARNTHRVLTEQIRALSDTVEWLREQLDEVQTGAMIAAAAAATPPEVAGPGVRHTETVHVTRRTTTVGSDQGGTVYGSPAAISDRRPAPEEPERHREEGHRDDRRAEYRDDRRDDYRDDRRDDYRDDRRDGHPDSRGAHHDSRGSRHEGRDSRDSRDGRHEGRDGRHEGRDGGDSRHDYRGDRDDRDGRYDRESRDGTWESAGDRWASLRTDDRGRELRMGERRSSVRSDDRGTEYRVEDRWQALRREDEPGYRESDWESTFKSLSTGGSQSGPKALPPARGETARSYLDEGRDEFSSYSGPRSRGRVRESEREQTYDDRDHYDRGHSDRGHSRDRDRERDHDRDRDHYERDRERDIPRPRGGYDDYR
jgi:hypothetical protein